MSDVQRTGNEPYGGLQAEERSIDGGVARPRYAVRRYCAGSGTRS
jgi:hypothetical protein